MTVTGGESSSPDLLSADSSAGHCWSSMVASFSCPICAGVGSSPRSTSRSEDITHTAEMRQTHPLTLKWIGVVSGALTHTRCWSLQETETLVVSQVFKLRAMIYRVSFLHFSFKSSTTCSPAGHQRDIDKMTNNITFSRMIQNQRCFLLCIRVLQMLFCYFG